MAFTNSSWDGAASNYPDTPSYCRACLINLNPEGSDPKDWTQDNCKLPVRTPSGDYNINAIHAAASALAGGRGGVKAPPETKAAAARKIKSLYGQMKEDVPDSLKRMG